MIYISFVFKHWLVWEEWGRDFNCDLWSSPQKFCNLNLNGILNHSQTRPCYAKVFPISKYLISLWHGCFALPAKLFRGSVYLNWHHRWSRWVIVWLNATTPGISFQRILLKKVKDTHLVHICYEGASQDFTNGAIIFLCLLSQP